MLRRANPALLLGLGLIVLAVLPTSASAHDSSACSGRASFTQASPGKGFYFARSLCGTGWDQIGVAAVPVRGNVASGGTILGIDANINVADDYAAVSGTRSITSGWCYVTVGIHAAFDIHFTAGHVSSWGPQFSVSFPLCV